MVTTISSCIGYNRQAAIEKEIDQCFSQNYSKYMKRLVATNILFLIFSQCYLLVYCALFSNVTRLALYIKKGQIWYQLRNFNTPILELLSVENKAKLSKPEIQNSSSAVFFTQNFQLRFRISLCTDNRFLIIAIVTNLPLLYIYIYENSKTR